MVGGKDGEVFLAEVMVFFSRMLEHGRFEFAESIGSCRCVLVEPG